MLSELKLANMKPLSLKLSVLNKIDLFLLPLILLASFLAHLDKNALAYAAVLGMNDDLHLHDQQYSWLGSIFYLGYLAMEFPVIWILTCVPMGKYLGTSLILWGACLSMMATSTGFTSAAVIRFLLGILEAGLLPTCILFTACWYRREEQPLRHALWFGPFSGIFGGIFAYAIGGIKASVPVWKILFLVYGGSTILLGLLCLLALPDNHEHVWFLSPKEREEARLRIQDNKTGVNMQKRWKFAHIIETLKDPKYWVLLVFGICQSITNAGITNFSPLILSGFGYSKEMTVLLAAPQGAVALVVQVAASLITLYVKNVRCLLWTVSCLPALVGVFIIRFIDVHQHRITALMGLYLTGFYNVSWVMAMSLISSNTAGGTKKSFGSASMAIFYAIGNMIGPQFFLDSQKPYYPLGVGAMVFAFTVMALCGALYGTICMFQNRLRDESQRESAPLMSVGDLDQIDDIEEYHDKTDFEIPTFRYTY